MVEYITDAPALLWHLYGPRRLGQTARKIFVDADAGRVRIYVPVVVVAEVLMVVQKGRLPGATLAHLLPHLEAMAGNDNYSLGLLESQLVIASHSYDAIPDIFDRLIVAEAISRGVARNSGLVPTIW